MSSRPSLNDAVWTPVNSVITSAIRVRAAHIHAHARAGATYMAGLGKQQWLPNRGY